jgi:thioredoxin-related protein
VSVYKKIEVVANIAIIAVALIIGGVFVKKYLFDNSSHAPLKIAAGTKVHLEDVDWAKNGQTLLVVLQKGCHFCAESAPFYQGLTREMEESKSAKLIAVLPQEVNESQQYLADLKVPISEVKKISPDLLGVSGTPTLILVNSAGAVIDSWTGKLTSDKEIEVLNKLKQHSPPPGHNSSVSNTPSTRG